MVNTEIPKRCTTSPSSFSSGTPLLTISREPALDFDSSNAFEGPEKLLEVWFSASSTTLPACAAPTGLKAVSVELWKDMLDLVNCKVLSIINSDDVDAYLLSESSMFVFPHKLILKTCGTTTLLSGLPRILETAALVAGFPHTSANPVQGIPAAASPYRVFYSRKNFLFPDRQRGPHRSWRDEVKSLDKLFLGGSAYMIGKMNGEHWYLYLTEPNTLLTPPATPDRAETETRIFDFPKAVDIHSLESAEDENEDETLEVLMTDLEEHNAKQFYLDHASAVAEGRFFQRAQSARKDAKQHLATIDEHENENGNLNDGCFNQNSSFNHYDAIDILSNTSSESGEFSSSDEDDDILPAELTTEGHALGTVVSESCGLADVYPISHYPDARVDAYLFTPCGFSANGVIPAPYEPSATHYFTVHVTPESHCSYASFETNVPARQSGKETAEVVEHVVDIFKPGRFSVTLFEAKQTTFLDDTDLNAGVGNKFMEWQIAKKKRRMDNIRGYRRVDRIVHDLEGYELVFRYFERLDWEGGAPRLGEVGF